MWCFGVDLSKPLVLAFSGLSYSGKSYVSIVEKFLEYYFDHLLSCFLYSFFLKYLLFRCKIVLNFLFYFPSLLHFVGYIFWFYFLRDFLQFYISIPELLGISQHESSCYYRWSSTYDILTYNF